LIADGSEWSGWSVSIPLLPHTPSKGVGRLDQAGQTRGLQNCMLWPAHDMETFTVSDLEMITKLFTASLTSHFKPHRRRGNVQILAL